GYVEGENVAVEYRWADNQTDRLPELASQLGRQKGSVITALGTISASAAKAATTTTPSVSAIGGEPLLLGLVTNRARPASHATARSRRTRTRRAIASSGPCLGSRGLALLGQPDRGEVDLPLPVQPPNAAFAEVVLRRVEPAPRPRGVEVRVFNGRPSREIDA